MAFGVLGVFLGLLLEVSTHGPHAVPRTSWRHQGETSCPSMYIIEIKKIEMWCIRVMNR